MLFSGKICIKNFQIFFLFRTGQLGLTNWPYVMCFFSSTPLGMSLNFVTRPRAPNHSIIPNALWFDKESGRGTKNAVRHLDQSNLVDMRVQLQTTKVNKLSISGTRFFGGNLMTVLKSDRQKELKNGVFILFPGCAKILSEFFCILHRHLSQSLRKILLIKLILITLCISISFPESSASLASFFLCNWCDSWDLVISSSTSPSLTMWWPREMMSLIEWKSKKGYFGGLQGCNVF